MMSDAQEAIIKITEGFIDITSDPESISLAVLLLHDVTGLKKKDIRKVLEYGPQLSRIYSKNQDFSVNKKPKAKIGAKTKAKRKRA